jgi:hypothetical protein
MVGCLDELGKIGAHPARGIIGLEAEYPGDCGEAFLHDPCVSAGMAVETDPTGTLLARRPHTRWTPAQA